MCEDFCWLSSSLFVWKGSFLGVGKFTAKRKPADRTQRKEEAQDLLAVGVKEKRRIGLVVAVNDGEACRGRQGKPKGRHAKENDEEHNALVFLCVQTAVNGGG